jgi:hypothetical protein
MKRAAMLLLFLLAGCASTDDFSGGGDFDCAKTNEVMVRIGLDGPGVSMERVEDRLQFRVEVSNNLDRDIVVKWVRVEQIMANNAPYLFDSTYRKFDQLIAEGGDFTFELPTLGRGAAMRSQDGLSRSVVAVVTSVGLESGDTYRCTFEVNSAR